MKTSNKDEKRAQALRENLRRRKEKMKAEKGAGKKDDSNAEKRDG